MNRKLLLIVFVMLLLVCAVSCDSGASGNDLVFDAGYLNDSWVKVAKGSKITIENMDNSMMYAVKTRGSSKGISRSTADPSNIFKGNMDTYIPIPDKDNRAIFTANSIDIHGSGSIQVIRLRDGSDDMKLDEVNDPVSFYNYDNSRVYEEYYHIDFSQEPYNSLDRSRIALLIYLQGSGSGSSNWGYATIGAGGIKPEVGTAGLYDFSGYDSINLYNTMTVDQSNNPWSQQLVITNPIRYEGSVAQNIPSKCNVYSVGPMDDGNDYVLEIDKVRGLYYADQFYMRYVNGDFNGFAFPVGSDSSKDVYYIGKIKKELLAEINIFAKIDEVSDFGTVTFRKATSEETTEYRSNFITINSDKFVFTMDLAAGDDKEYKFIVEPEVGRTLNDMYIKTEYTYDDGTYIEGYCRTSTKSSHTYGIGYSTNSFTGSYTIFPQRSADLLENLSIQVKDEKPVNVKITFEKSNSVVIDDYLTNGCKLFVINGNEITVERIKINNNYTVPELEKSGYTFRGMYYNGNLFKKGDLIPIKNAYSAITAAWDL